MIVYRRSILFQEGARAMPDDSVDAYIEHAANCIRTAQETKDTESRLSLLGMAQAWLRLAEHSQRSERSADPPLIGDSRPQ